MRLDDLRLCNGLKCLVSLANTVLCHFGSDHSTFLLYAKRGGSPSVTFMLNALPGDNLIVWLFSTKIRIFFFFRFAEQIKRQHVERNKQNCDQYGKYFEYQQKGRTKDTRRGELVEHTQLHSPLPSQLNGSVCNHKKTPDGISSGR